MRERCARRDRSSSRVAAPHARATSRLTAPSPSLAPRGTANSPPRPRRRLASPSACARRYVPSRARTASEARWVVFDFPSRVFPARVVPRPRRRAKTPRVNRVDRSVHVRIARSAHRRSPFPTATGRSRSRGEGSRGEEARAHRPPSRLPGATLAATRPRLLRGSTSRRRRRTNGNASMPHPGTDHTTPKRRVVHRPNAPGGFEGARRARAASAGSRGCTPVGSRAAHTREIALEKSRFRAFTSRWPKEVMTGTCAGATRG
jgi:hypothetical protein